MMSKVELLAYKTSSWYLRAAVKHQLKTKQTPLQQHLDPHILISVLGYIELKTNELLTLHLAVNSPKNRNQMMLGEDGLPKDSNFMNTGTVGGLLGQGPTAAIGKISIVAPSTGYDIYNLTFSDDHDSDDALSDEDERPLSREEIKSRTLKGLSRRAEKSARANPTKTATVKKSKRRGKKLD
jgi:hypothetical protein